MSLVQNLFQKIIMPVSLGRANINWYKIYSKDKDCGHVLRTYTTAENNRPEDNSLFTRGHSLNGNMSVDTLFRERPEDDLWREKITLPPLYLPLQMPHLYKFLYKFCLACLTARRPNMLCIRFRACV